MSTPMKKLALREAIFDVLQDFLLRAQSRGLDLKLRNHAASTGEIEAAVIHKHPHLDPEAVRRDTHKRLNELKPRVVHFGHNLWAVAVVGVPVPAQSALIVGMPQRDDVQPARNAESVIPEKCCLSLSILQGILEKEYGLHIPGKVLAKERSHMPCAHLYDGTRLYTAKSIAYLINRYTEKYGNSEWF